MATLDNIDAMMKVGYPHKEMARQWHEEFDFMKWLPRRNDFGGKRIDVAIGVDMGGGNSHDFAAAQAQEDTDNTYVNWQVTRKRDYALVYIDNEAIEASEYDKYAFANALTDKLDGATNRLKLTLAYELHGNGGGSIGRVSTITGAGAGAVLTLSDPEQIFRFSINQQLQASVDNGLAAGGVRGGTPGYMKVTALDEDNGKVTVDNSTYITGLTTNDYLFPRGNYNKAPTGLDRYLPSASDFTSYPTLHGQSRATNRSKLAGILFDGSSYGLAEAFERGLRRARAGHAYPDSYWVNSTTFTNLSIDLGAKAQREFVRIGNFGFDAIHVFAYGRKVPVMVDNNVPTGIAWGLTRKTLVWHTLGECPRYLTGGAKTIVKPTADGVEARLGWRGDLIMLDPSKNIRLILPS